MKSCKGFTILCLFIFYSCMVLAGETVPFVGTADFKMLVSLHPLMVDYDPVFNAFYVEINDKEIADHQDKISRAKEELQHLQEDRESYLLSYEKLKNEYDVLTREASENYRRRRYGLTATASIVFENTAYDQEIRRINREYNQELNQYSDKITAATDKINDLRAQISSSVGYTSGDETSKRLQQVIQEVKAAVKTAAEKNHLQLVIDSSNSSLLTKKSGKKFFHRSGFCGNDDYKEIIRVKGRLNHLERFKGIPDKMFKKISREVSRFIPNSIREQSEVGSSLLEQCPQLLPSSCLLVGGKDITQNAMGIILNKHGIDPKASKLILNGIGQLLAEETKGE